MVPHPRPFQIAQTEIKQVESLPRVLGMDEYKGDTREGKDQLIYCRWGHQATRKYPTEPE